MNSRAREAAARIANGELSSEDLVRACLARIAERDPSVKAFAYVGSDAALAAARDADTEGVAPRRHRLGRFTVCRSP